MTRWVGPAPCMASTGLAEPGVPGFLLRGRFGWVWLVLVAVVLAAALGTGQRPVSMLGQLGVALGASASVGGWEADAEVGGRQWPVGLRQAALGAVLADVYRARPVQQGSWQVANPAQAFRAVFTPAGVEVQSAGGRGGAWRLGLALSGIGRGGALASVAVPTLGVEGGRVAYQRGPVSEWYVNDPGGLQQGFALASPPSGAGPVSVGVDLIGDLIPQLRGDARGVVLTDPAGR